MKSLPTWAVWSIVAPLMLLSPVIALMLAIVGEALICAIIDLGPPTGAVLAALAGMLILWRKARLRARRPAPRRLATSGESP
jgi:hypothetical protein